MQCYNHLCRCSDCTAIIILCSKMAWKNLKWWSGGRASIMTFLQVSSWPERLMPQKMWILNIFQLSQTTSPKPADPHVYSRVYSTTPYHIQTRPNCRNRKGRGWMYMTHKSSCCSNSRVIAFFNNFCPPTNGWLAGVQEPAWMGGRCQNELDWKLHGIVAPLFFNSPLLSALKWPAREGGGQV